MIKTIKTAMGLHDTPKEAIDHAWHDYGLRIDWLGLERTLRAILDGKDTESGKLALIREALSAFTGR